MTERKIIEKIKAQPASDGDGVKMLRVFGGRGPERFDPFLMLDEFGSAEASDYIGGFPPHPHRGFETITYMLQGKMEHRDHMNNVGLLSDGDVQWMTAGRGIIHSEMPKQTQGRMRGFQFWLNLPAEQKMKAAQYQDIPHAELPTLQLEGVNIIGLAGDGTVNGERFSGYVKDKTSRPIIWDVHLSSGATLNLSDLEASNLMLYVYEGEIEVGASAAKAQELVRLSAGEHVVVKNTGTELTRLMVFGGVPIAEPIVQYGPFVMNSPEEIEQAILDYRAGNFGA